MNYLLRRNLLHNTLCAVALFAMTTAFSQNASADIVFTEDFSYADGNLAGNGGWVGHSGGDPTVMISGGQAVVDQGAGSQDVNRQFAEIGSGLATFQFDMVVTAPGAMTGTDFEYFAHFGSTTDGTSVSGFVGRLDVVVPSGAGDYSLGIATFSSTADAVTAQSFNFGDTISVLVSYDTALDQASLTVGGETVLGVQGTIPGSVNTFALRQSGSSSDEIVRIDNLVVSQITAIPEPGSLAALCLLGTTVVASRRRRRR